MEKNNSITVQVTIHAPINKIWEKFTHPDEIVHWYFASDDWHAPKASNDLNVGGAFVITMSAKDGSFSFDFSGTYSKIIQYERIEYTIPDGRKVTVLFDVNNDSVKVTEIFEMETINSPEQQQQGWQAILDNFKKHVDGKL